jgi:hypothetical protein
MSNATEHAVRELAAEILYDWTHTAGINPADSRFSLAALRQARDTLPGLLRFAGEWDRQAAPGAQAARMAAEGAV